jgi:hypothetical protein
MASSTLCSLIIVRHSQTTWIECTIQKPELCIMEVNLKYSRRLENQSTNFMRLSRDVNGYKEDARFSLMRNSVFDDEYMKKER